MILCSERTKRNYTTHWRETLLYLNSNGLFTSSCISVRLIGISSLLLIGEIDNILLHNVTVVNMRAFNAIKALHNTSGY